MTKVKIVYLSRNGMEKLATSKKSVESMIKYIIRAMDDYNMIGYLAEVPYGLNKRCEKFIEDYLRCAKCSHSCVYEELDESKINAGALNGTPITEKNNSYYPLRCGYHGQFVRLDWLCNRYFLSDYDFEPYDYKMDEEYDLFNYGKECE